jgi:predicted nucleic acid-binding protein
VDTLALRIWGKLISKKSYAVNEDAVIAAIAISNHLTTVTRNAEDFQRFKVSPTNPFK